MSRELTVEGESGSAVPKRQVNGTCRSNARKERSIMSGALLDCAVCNSRKWTNLESKSVDELHSSGATKLFCDNCGNYTYWLFSQNGNGSDPQRREPEPASRIAAGIAETPHSNGGAEVRQDPIMRLYQPERRRGDEDRRDGLRRTDRRVALQLPVKLRVNSNEAQFEEVTRTLNVCHTGIYVQTERPYSKGQVTYVALNYSPQESGRVAEQRGTVVRVDSFAGSKAKGVAIQLH